MLIRCGNFLKNPEALATPVCEGKVEFDSGVAVVVVMIDGVEGVDRVEIVEKVEEIEELPFEKAKERSVKSTSGFEVVVCKLNFAKVSLAKNGDSFSSSTLGTIVTIFILSLFSGSKENSVTDSGDSVSSGGRGNLFSGSESFKNGELVTGESNTSGIFRVVVGGKDVVVVIGMGTSGGSVSASTVVEIV